MASDRFLAEMTLRMIRLRDMLMVSATDSPHNLESSLLNFSAAVTVTKEHFESNMVQDTSRYWVYTLG